MGKQSWLLLVGRVSPSTHIEISSKENHQSHGRMALPSHWPSPIDDRFWNNKVTAKATTATEVVMDILTQHDAGDVVQSSSRELKFKLNH
jgi:hypothetical protein